MVGRKPAKRARRADSDDDDDVPYTTRAPVSSRASYEDRQTSANGAADKDAGLRARMYAHETDADLATFVDRFWRHQMTLAERDYDEAAESPTDDAPPDDAAFEDDDETTRLARLAPPLTDWKAHTLPLARIKKVQKLDPEVKMIATEVPMLFARACETFIAELTTRAWIVAQASRRKTISRSDIAGGVAQTRTLDFLLDIVPRGEGGPGTTLSDHADEDEFRSPPLPPFQRQRHLDVQAAMTEEHAATDELLAMANGGDHEGHGMAWETREGPFAAAVQAGAYLNEG